MFTTFALWAYYVPKILASSCKKRTKSTKLRTNCRNHQLQRISLGGEVKSAVPHRGPSLYIDGESVGGRKSVLSSCLVGRFDKEVGSCDRVKEWAARAWNTTCGVGVTLLSDSLLFRFPSQAKAKRVLKEGRRQWGSATLRIDAWSFRVGCCGILSDQGLKQIRLFGLPLHLWCHALFVEVGELCGGYVRSDADETRDAESVRIIVRSGRDCPKFMFINNDTFCYKVAIWEEISPELVPSTESLEGSDGSHLMSEEKWNEIISKGKEGVIEIQQWLKDREIQQAVKFIGGK